MLGQLENVASQTSTSRWGLSHLTLLEQLFRSWSVQKRTIDWQDVVGDPIHAELCVMDG
jgi:hypothetical protein